VDASLGAFVAGVAATGSREARQREAELRRAGKRRAADLLGAIGAVSQVRSCAHAPAANQSTMTTTPPPVVQAKNPVREYWRAQAERAELREEWERAWRAARLDCLLTPAHVMPPPAPGAVAASGATLCYTQLFNLLDFPAGTVPVCRAEEADQDLTAWPQRILDEQFGASARARAARGEIYGAQDDFLEDVVRASCVGAAGLPVSVQVVALPWREERCLGIMAEIEQAAPRPRGTRGPRAPLGSRE
jgi:Asp-tRNA(Asn)/Glu-tRNA(Gln) amidotransferase A subunit family amidase